MLTILAILSLLNITPSEQSVDYVENKQQFQLHKLMTEQRHPKTWNLSRVIREDTAAGIESLLSVDEDISKKFQDLDTTLLEQAAKSVERAIRNGNKIYIYGCGATGRLAKQMESSFWRPFWKKMGRPEMENLLIGEMTGADRALISSLEGFEDLQLIGKLQLQEHNITSDDVVFAITEGGETSSVIGTILAAKGDRYFIYNNPDEVLLPLDRSRSVLENEAITKIPLYTGPQGITGSTRLQATTSETFVMGIILEHAISTVLGLDTLTMKERLLSFIPVQKAVYAKRNEIAKLTDLEANTYANKRFSTYFAQDALITVFIDSTERAPTFRLFPLDSVQAAERKSWIQVWTHAADPHSAWQTFLGRSFSGLDPALYEEPFATQIADPYLQRAALNSLKNAGNDQQYLYDFSFSSQRAAPEAGDLGVMAYFDGDDLTSYEQWLNHFNQAQVGMILVTTNNPPLEKRGPCIILPISSDNDPLKLRQHIGLKMLLNAHSTGVMAKLGRVVGNTMTNVNPGNLKLIGRATFLIMSHLNNKISYAEANAVLFDAIEYAKKSGKVGQNSEVGLSIIRISEGLKTGVDIGWEKAEEMLQTLGLEKCLSL